EPTAAVPIALPRSWVVTGGARGVTARIAERLAALGQPALYLLGAHVLPDAVELERWRVIAASGPDAVEQTVLAELKATGRPYSAADWKARRAAIDKSLEIAANLERLRATGAHVEYHAVDLSDRTGLAAVLDHVRRRGPIEGLVHGAGVEVAKPFDKKSDELLAATLAGKVDGLVALLALTADDPLGVVLGFSSVSGRFGGHGQADYALANEVMAHLLAELRQRRPSVRATAFSWPAFGEVGLAMRGSARVFLERAGQRFMAPAEGANHVVRELALGLPEPEVTICDAPPGLDLDHLLPLGDEEHTSRRALTRALADRPMLGAAVASSAERVVVERVLDAAEPFLAEHRMGRTPILPAVISLEAFAELASIATRDGVLADVEIHQPLKVPEGARRTMRVERAGDTLRLGAAIERSDGVVLDPDRTHVTGRVTALSEAERRALVDDLERRAALVVPKGALADDRVPYPYLDRFDASPGSSVIFHGPPLQVVTSVAKGIGAGRALLVVPEVEALVRGSRRADWHLPASLLDGCLQAAGLLGRLLYGVTALPLGFGLVVSSRAEAFVPGDEVVLDVVFRPAEGDVLASDLVARTTRGAVLAVRSYRASVLR
ncbi:SDR family NAD(P)-dependent oxidoreductase, partial [Myxococcota bacterium]|nr:SDR family NAD(P)-dependent oxidoreductase [Myxococcota bacterium]